MSGLSFRYTKRDVNRNGKSSVDGNEGAPNLTEQREQPMKPEQAAEPGDSEELREESLLWELEKRPDEKLSKDDVLRVARMVNEYQGRIKAYLKEQQDKKLGKLDRLADLVALFGGSWWFILTFAGIIAGWILWNQITGHNSLFYLSFSLSCLSIFSAPFILMSQNRQAMKDKQEQMLDIAINYKAEQENLEIKRMIQQLDERLQHMERYMAEDHVRKLTKDEGSGSSHGRGWSG